MSLENPRKVTVEDLIRLKRSERPADEFWAQFEAQMRAKQLAAIVVRRPWWDGAARVLARAYRHSLPVGAAAAVALAWVAVRKIEVPVAESRSAAPVSRAAGRAEVAAVASDSRALVPLKAAPSQRQPQAAVPVVAATTSHITQIPTEAAPQQGPRNPFADAAPVALADMRAPASMPGLMKDPFSTDREFEAIVTPLPRGTDSEPLARIDPSAERRERLLAPALPVTASSGGRTVAANWSKSRDERIYESMDLYGSSDRAVAGFRF